MKRLLLTLSLFALMSAIFTACDNEPEIMPQVLDGGFGSAKIGQQRNTGNTGRGTRGVPVDSACESSWNEVNAEE